MITKIGELASCTGVHLSSQLLGKRNRMIEPESLRPGWVTQGDLFQNIKLTLLLQAHEQKLCYKRPTPLFSTDSLPIQADTTAKQGKTKVQNNG